MMITERQIIELENLNKKTMRSCYSLWRRPISTRSDERSYYWYCRFWDWYINSMRCERNQE